MFNATMHFLYFLMRVLYLARGGPQAEDDELADDASGMTWDHASGNWTKVGTEETSAVRPCAGPSLAPSRGPSLVPRSRHLTLNTPPPHHPAMPLSRLQDDETITSIIGIALNFIFGVMSFVCMFYSSELLHLLTVTPGMHHGEISEYSRRNVELDNSRGAAGAVHHMYNNAPMVAASVAPYHVAMGTPTPASAAAAAETSAVTAESRVPGVAAAGPPMIATAVYANDAGGAAGEGGVVHVATKAT